MSRLSQVLLWAALVLALIGTLKHTAWAFATLENGDMLSGIIQAAALDVGMVALALGIQSRKRAGERTRWLWSGAGVFCAISVYANFLHGYAHQSALNAPWADWRPGLLAAVLPLMLFYLVEIVSHTPSTGHVAPQAAPVRDAERASSDVADAEPAHDDAPSAQPAAPRLEVLPPVHRCPHGCGGEFRTQQALAAHVRHCKARVVAASAAVGAD